MEDPAKPYDVDKLGHALTMLKAHELGNSQALHPAHAAVILTEVERMRSKIEDMTEGKTVLVMNDEDRAKAAIDLDDASLAKWARAALIFSDRAYATKAERMRSPIASVTLQHGVISLALAAFSANAGKLEATVRGVVYKGEDIGDWTVTVAQAEPEGEDE